jgi:hypothetical protein
MASAVCWAALPYVGDQRRGHDNDAPSRAALPGGGKQRAGQKVTSKDRPAGASRARSDPLHHPRGDQQARPDGQTPGNACREEHHQADPVVDREVRLGRRRQDARPSRMTGRPQTSVQARRADRWTWRCVQSRRRFCARTFARGIARPGGIAETLPALVRAALGVHRGHHGRGGLCETGETGVVVLITQRSQVQILPPLPGKTASGSWIPGPFSNSCDQGSGHK